MNKLVPIIEGSNECHEPVEESRANLKLAERVAVLQIEPAEKRGHRWVIGVGRGERTAYLSDDRASPDAAPKLCRSSEVVLTLLDQKPETFTKEDGKVVKL